MGKSQSIPITHLKDGNFIEIYQLETMDDSFFKIYQRYDFYQILWFTQVNGNNSYFIDFVDYSFHANQAVIIYPGQIDRIHIEGKEGLLFAIDKETYLNINERINSKYLSGYYSNVFISPKEETCRSIEQLIKLILHEYNHEGRLILMETYMRAFLFEIADSFEKAVEPSQRMVNNIAAELRELIGNYYIPEPNTSFYAKKLGVTNRKLNEVALQSFGLTVKQLLQERLLLAIKREIKLGEKTMKEIAFDLGFQDPAYMTRFFKKHTGVPPSWFRGDSK